MLEHEISEVLGRVTGYPTSDYTPLDLFRYGSPGVLATTRGAAYFSIDSGTTNLAQFNNNTAYGGDAGDWSSHGGDVNLVAHDAYDAFSSPGVVNSVSATDLTVMQMLGYSLAPACYAAGTRILTAPGEVLVEDLAVGDMVQGQFAGLTPITWIGLRCIDCRHHPDPRCVWPVCVVAGAVGPNQPHRDMLLSPDHAVAVGDALIPIRLLANGASIRHETGMPAGAIFPHRVAPARPFARGWPGRRELP